MSDIVYRLRRNHPTPLEREAADEIERLRAMWQPAPRGGMTSDWQYWSLVYQRRLRKLKKLIAAQGYDIVSDEDGMPTALERNKP